MKKLFIPFILLSLCSLTYANDTHLKSKSNKSTPSTPPNLLKLNKKPHWIRVPKPIYLDGDLEGKARKADISIDVDTTGKIIDAKVIRSTGLQNLDNILLRAIYNARMTVYTENNVAYPFRAILPFEITSNDYSSTKKSKLVTVKPPQKTCKFNLNTEIYKLHKNQEKTPFYYKNPPVLYIYEHEIKSENSSIEFSFHLSRNDILSNLRITKSSGSDDIDSRFLFAMRNVKIQAPRKLFQLHTFQFKDEIKLNPEEHECITTYVN
ncbi:energy transducer TonB [Acinetobacter faecalis]|uniref:energy transducer TonB n=1 Tax=Acinetobacter faecalis TaxID=2665161 RepID=UPI002A91DB02|nr:energy transducer TonB [Acinetobacter faecalis]MDY6483049.1 energy transducer TonB [Acinetobacter faecalis]